MTIIRIKTADMKFVGWYCENCDQEFNWREAVGTMWKPLCPNCKQEIFPLYDIGDTAIYTMESDNAK